MAMCYKLRVLGVTINGPTQILEDSESVGGSWSIPSIILNKKHNAINYHQVREAVAAGVIILVTITETSNPSDLLTKPLGPNQPYLLCNSYLFKSVSDLVWVSES